ncbi:efflux RND transporter periplasmic adaptor subunit [Paraneptunicella aestuarii]|uniref:efflux RND transporter periplasmic adaptor subunit n=1 Tax=Paraneptunicella aestuarii TaxID=2831148 RepID=UPI001E488CEF|nr:efflux RND transporter periplasmic adaptor subunit [Paraneptunicella aestuarii]
MSANAWAQANKPEPPATLVELDDIKVEMVSEQIWVPGTVVSRSDANIAAEVAGRLAWVAEVGEVVEQGEVLARIDDRLMKLEHQQNIANIAKWQARVELLQRKQERFGKMAELNNTSRDQLDEIVSDLEIARQELAQAELNKAQSEYHLEQTQVKAPFRALVVERIQAPGEYTSVGSDLLRVVDTANVEASIRAPLSAVPFLKPGLNVAVKSSVLEKQQSIRAIVPVGNAVSRMMEVRVALRPGDFPIGSAVRVALPHSDYHQGVTVPRDALVLRKSGTFIFVVDENNQAVQVPVTTGVGLGSRIEVFGELDDTTNVVVRGAELLKAGQKVRYNDMISIAKAQ